MTDIEHAKKYAEESISLAISMYNPKAEIIAETACLYGLTFKNERIAELEKENAELKDYRLTTLAKQQTGMSKYALNLEHKLSWYDDQLTKAKELLERLLITSCNSDVLNLLPNCSEVLRVRVEAEQFLSEVEK